jgi:plasmid stabilization system protein ParE
MTAYRLTSRAEADLFAIWLYIARDSIEAADRVESAIFSACKFLADSPLAGHVRPELTKLPLRFWTIATYTRYVVVYNPATKPIEIIRIFHGARNLKRELRK